MRLVAYPFQKQARLGLGRALTYRGSRLNLFGNAYKWKIDFEISLSFLMA